MLKPKAIYFQIMENGKKWKNTFHSSSEFQSSKVRVFQGREPRLIVIYYRSKINREGRVKRTHYPLLFFLIVCLFPSPIQNLLYFTRCFTAALLSLCYHLSCLFFPLYFVSSLSGPLFVIASVVWYLKHISHSHSTNWPLWDGQ